MVLVEEAVTSRSVFDCAPFFLNSQFGLKISSTYFVLTMSDVLEPTEKEWQGCSERVFEDLYHSWHRKKSQDREDENNLQLLRGEYLSQVLSPIQNRGLGLVLQDKEKDFVVTSEDEGRFPVHSYLLNGLWPFFETATSIDMIEKESKTLHLPYPREWVEVLVDFFYGKQILTIDVDVATGLLVIASLYDIPELKELATNNIMTDDRVFSLDEAMRGWRRAQESDSTAVQDLFAKFLSAHLSKIEDSPAALEYSETQLLALFCQAVKLR